MRGCALSRQASTLASVFGGEAREWYGVICSLSAEDDISQGEAAKRLEMWGHECAHGQAECFRLAREEERRPNARECLQALISYRTERVMTELLVLCSFYPLPTSAVTPVTIEEAARNLSAAMSEAGAPARTRAPPGLSFEEMAARVKAHGGIVGAISAAEADAFLRSTVGAPARTHAPPAEAYADRGESMHRPGTYVRRARVIVDGDCDSVTWGTAWMVVVPDVGTVAEFNDRHYPTGARGLAHELADLYNEETITQAGLFEWHARIGGGGVR